MSAIDYYPLQRDGRFDPTPACVIRLNEAAQEAAERRADCLDIVAAASKLKSEQPGLTQADIAERIGVNAPRLRKLLRKYR